LLRGLSADTGRDHPHLMPEAAQGVNHFFDVDGLPVFGGGAVVVEDSHGLGIIKLIALIACYTLAAEDVMAASSQ
jgi:hypothetical protein